MTKSEYIKEWHKNHKDKTRLYKLKWYYKNKKHFNAMRSNVV